MKIQKAISLYTLTRYEENNKSAFFQKPYESKYYYDTIEGLRQGSSWDRNTTHAGYLPIPALKEKDSHGAERVVLLLKCELGITNLRFTDELQQVIKENRDSVIAVSLTKVVSYLKVENTNDSQPFVSYTVNCTDTIDAETKFLYTEKKAGSYFVERGSEVNITPYQPVCVDFSKP